MGKYDNQVKQVYSTYHPANVSETYTIYEINDLAFNALEQIIHEYRLRYVDTNTVINYLNLIETAENPQEMLNEIRAILFNSVASDNYIIELLYFAANMILKILIKITDKPTEFIINEIYSLYLEKNDIYGDSWYGRGSHGIYTELERKVYRFNRVISHNQIENQIIEPIEDTLKDTLNYITFFIICLKYVDPHMS